AGQALGPLARPQLPGLYAFTGFGNVGYMVSPKRILAIETSGRHGSAATLWGDSNDRRLVRQIVLTGEQRTAQALAPSLKELLAESEWPANSIELVAVAAGPGSFTGLRIGVTTAKTF